MIAGSKEPTWPPNLPLIRHHDASPLERPAESIAPSSPPPCTRPPQFLSGAASPSDLEGCVRKPAGYSKRTTFQTSFERGREAAVAPSLPQGVFFLSAGSPLEGV
jgi:hypothetical protein